MDNLITETNQRLQELINNLTTIKNEYESKLNNNNKEIEEQLNKVKSYKEDFFSSKQKIEKMNSDIEGFEEDYKKLVERFKDDELANILIAANKEISAKIEERRKKISRDKIAMNELVELAEQCKTKLVKLTAEKKALELCLARILDSHEYYSKSLTQIINYSEENRDNLSSCFYEGEVNPNINIQENSNNSYFGTNVEDIEEIILENDFDTIDLDDDYDDDDEEEYEVKDLEKEEIEEINIDHDFDGSDDLINEDEEIEISIDDIDIDDVDQVLDEIEFDENEEIENDLEDEEISELVQEDEDDLEDYIGIDDELEDDDSLYE